MAYEHLIDKDVDLSAIGFGDCLTFEYNKVKGLLRISIFENSHYQDHIVVNLVDEFGRNECEEDYTLP